ncbi:MAG: GDP-mannose 4,6-dehydratase [Gemmatimonadaceae bacterium]|nr:GDP-mannose 4,6-dehydratase [Gemmatimonadaceae bacterium]
MPRALVTGAGGFVGQWLCRALLASGWDVTGTTIDGSPTSGILTDAESAAVTWRGMDLRPGIDRRTLGGLLERSRPDAVFHLAAVAFVPAAGADPMRALDTNVGAAVRLVESMRLLRAAGTLDAALLVIGSAEQYGRHDESAMPLSESDELRPRTFYAATKCAQEAFALAAARSDGLRVVATRSFNHSGSGQSAQYLLPSLVARALDERRSPGAGVRIGNTETIRDFLHVEDVVAAYISLVERGRSGETYNVCSGEGASVGQIAGEVLAQAGIEGPLVSDPALRRTVDVPVLVGDNTKLRTDTGWTPRRTRAHIIDDLLNAAP